MDKPEIDFERINRGRGVRELIEQEANQPKDPPARFCGNECRNNYREDRLNCKELQPVSMNGQMVSHKAMCAQLALCAYCQSKLEK